LGRALAYAGEKIAGRARPSRGGPRVKLLRDSYSKELRFKEKGKIDERGRGLKRRYDKDDKD
jgi:hypothetical protein